MCACGSQLSMVQGAAGRWSNWYAAIFADVCAMFLQGF